MIWVGLFWIWLLVAVLQVLHSTGLQSEITLSIILREVVEVMEFGDWLPLVGRGLFVEFLQWKQLRLCLMVKMNIFLAFGLASFSFVIYLYKLWGGNWNTWFYGFGLLLVLEPIQVLLKVLHEYWIWRSQKGLFHWEICLKWLLMTSWPWTVIFSRWVLVVREFWCSSMFYCNSLLSQLSFNACWAGQSFNFLLVMGAWWLVDEWL